MKVYMVVSKCKYAYPVAVFDSLVEASRWLGVPWETIRTALKRHGAYRGKNYDLEVINVPTD